LIDSRLGERSWVKWEIIYKSKDQEGLGIGDIEKFYIVLLTKWKWRLGVENDVIEGNFRIYVWYMKEFK